MRGGGSFSSCPSVWQSRFRLRLLAKGVDCDGAKAGQWEGVSGPCPPGPGSIRHPKGGLLLLFLAFLYSYSTAANAAVTGKRVYPETGSRETVMPAGATSITQPVSPARRLSGRGCVATPPENHCQPDLAQGTDKLRKLDLRQAGMVANLSGLEIRFGTLSPVFTSSTVTYTASVAARNRLQPFPPPGHLHWRGNCWLRPGLNFWCWCA